MSALLLIAHCSSLIAVAGSSLGPGYLSPATLPGERQLVRKAGVSQAARKESHT